MTHVQRKAALGSLAPKPPSTKLSKSSARQTKPKRKTSFTSLTADDRVDRLIDFLFAPVAKREAKRKKCSHNRALRARRRSCQSHREFQA